MNIQSAELVVLAVGAFLGAMGLGVRGVERDAHPTVGGWKTTLLVLLPFVVLHALFREDHRFLAGYDEYTRLNLSLIWADRPFFAAGKMVWLPGQFYVIGGLYRAGCGLEWAVAITSLAGIALTIHFAIRVASFAWRSRAAGMIAGVLAGAQWMMLIASVNPYAEVFFLPAFMGALDAWLRGWAARNDPRGPDVAYRYYVIAAAWVGFGTLFRFEMWYAGMVLGAFCVVVMLRELRRRDVGRAGELLLACALIAAYPLTWLAVSWLRLGSPMAFVEFARQQNEITNVSHDFSTPWSRFWIYPGLLLDNHPQRLGLALCGGVLAALPAYRYARPLVAAWGAVLLTAMTVSVKGGVGSANTARMVLFSLIPLLCIAAGPLSRLWWLRPPLRAWARTAAVAFLVVTAALSLTKARNRDTNAWGVEPGVLGIMTRLECELDAGRWAVEVPLIRPRWSTLYVYDGGRRLDYWMARYHSGEPERVRGVDTPGQLERALSRAPAGSRFLILEPRPEIAFPARARLLEEPAPYELWEVR